MNKINYTIVLISSLFLLCEGTAFAESTDEDNRCEAMLFTANQNFTMARLIQATDDTPTYCYLKGIISPSIVYHLQFPIPENWNGNFLNWGDGGHDGDLDYAPHRVAEGYAVVNSNMGHDNGTEPGAIFAFNNRHREIDYGYRHILLVVKAAKSAIKTYYGMEAEYSYHEGCSTGGRQGLMNAQRFPQEFDGIVAGAPASFLQPLNLEHNWEMQQMFKNNFAGNLAFDTNGDGEFDSLTKAHMLIEAVKNKCDAIDGINDSVIDDPLSCDFNPSRDLKGKMCRRDKNADNCFTRAQVNAIQAIYDGPSDSKGVSIMKGKALGSEIFWPWSTIPHQGNHNFPGQMGLAQDFVNYLFFEIDPGMPPANPIDLSITPDTSREPPEYAWWQFNFDNFTAGLGDTMRDITDADDRDLTRYLINKGGKLLLYHGWADPIIPAEPIIDYYNEMLDVTYDGKRDVADDSVRLFLAPGVAHCSGGPGPDQWDRLAPMVDWVEHGRAPDHLIAQHRTDDKVDNERKVCAYPKKAVYAGPRGGNDNPANWVEGNFECR